ncbi:hypothetical protein VQ02_20065 [Methylobacterium variabile]|jgi:diguanylate cyclase (GGDEF)-like protein|uniref:GGDEF domain-containing protein n=1 Tax=Methylobacterium variabile TaxID=298794 RepID=A0A0J6SKB4_9HYPH|nr:GGDEF domain-containing protein [Methylobacterium variabile]KMO33828.1 hypothetical protein VQ02_20065 [Methylobacterium variabile]
MPDATPSYLLPTLPPVRWLVDPGCDLPPNLRVRLLATLLSSATGMVIGGVAMLIITLAAAIRHPDPVFLCLAAANAGLLVLRLGLLVRSRRVAARGSPVPTDLLLASSLVWAGLVGATTVLCFSSGDPLLQILAPLTMMGILCGIVTRNNAAPRLAVAMIVLCDLPLKLMMPIHFGDAWFLIGTLQGVLFLAAMSATTVQLNRGYVQVLLAEQENQRRAVHDPLTGLRNRTGLMEDLAGRLPGDGDLALLYLDLDGFKAVNDRFGHAAGDALLVQVAERIGAAIPQEWQAARLGGDEFVILAGGRRVHLAKVVAAQLIEALRAPYDLGPARHDGIGVSIGLASAAAGTSPEALLAEADAALYRAKAAGKGRCATAREPRAAAARVA